MNLENINQLFSSIGSKPVTQIFCIPVPTIDACVLCDSHGYSDRHPEEIISEHWFNSHYGRTYTWEHWNESDHAWNLAGHQILSDSGKFIPNILVLYYSPDNPEFIEKWMGVDDE